MFDVSITGYHITIYCPVVPQVHLGFYWFKRDTSQPNGFTRSGRSTHHPFDPGGVCVCNVNSTYFICLCNIWYIAFNILYVYRKISDISGTKFSNLNVSRFVLQLSMPNLMMPCVKSRMKMRLEQRRQAMLQLHLSDRQSYCLLRCGLY